MSLSRSSKLVQVARQVARDLRKSQTPAEKLLWLALRNRKLNGLKFLRQHPILVEFQDKETFFVADFYCAETKLIVELDGSVHDRQQERDILRDSVLKNMGYRILRIRNREIGRDLAAVMEKIKKVSRDCGEQRNSPPPLERPHLNRLSSVGRAIPPLFPEERGEQGGVSWVTHLTTPVDFLPPQTTTSWSPIHPIQ